MSKVCTLNLRSKQKLNLLIKLPGMLATRRHANAYGCILIQFGRCYAMRYGVVQCCVSLNRNESFSLLFLYDFECIQAWLISPVNSLCFVLLSRLVHGSRYSIRVSYTYTSRSNKCPFLRYLPIRKRAQASVCFAYFHNNNNNQSKSFLCRWQTTDR